MSVPPRTTPAAVQGVLGGTTETSNWDGMTDLTPFIQAASAIVDRVVTASANRLWAVAGVTLSAAELEQVERWLSAHFYCMMDPLYNSKATGGASGTFQRKSQGEGFESTEYGRAACNIDYSGCLRAIGLRQFAGMDWAGVRAYAANEWGWCNYPGNPPGLWQP